VAGRVLIAGGSGLVGRALAAALAADGAEVVVLSRSAAGGPPLAAGVRHARWDGRSAAGWRSECEGAAAIVNLAGENVGAGRWTTARKRRLVASRLEPTRALVEAITAASRRPAVLLQASAVGFYGARGPEAIDEDAPAGSGFLSGLAAEWEEAARPVEALGLRRVLLRTGLVLAREGGALAKLLRPFRLGLGGPLGDGRQWMPWIHLADEVGAIRFLLERADLAAAFNLTAPEPVPNLEFSRALARELRRPCFARVPASVLRVALGEMAEILLTGQRALPRRLLAAGYRFRFERLEAALADLVGRRRGA
jgi:uncharacterized protein (TIGR01777 family)